MRETDGEEEEKERKREEEKERKINIFILLFLFLNCHGGQCVVVLKSEIKNSILVSHLSKRGPRS